MDLQTKSNRRAATWAAVMGAGVLAALAFGVPASESGGCGGPETATSGEDMSAAPAAAAGRQPASISGSVASDPSQRVAAPPPTTILLVWDMPSGAAYKMGQGTLSNGAFTLALPSAPPDGAVMGGAVAVAHLIAVPFGTTIADGPLDQDAANGLTQEATGTSGARALIYKAGTSPSLPWLSSFSAGFSCGKGQPPAANAPLVGGAPIAGFAPTPCSGITFSLTGFDSSAFTNWAPVAVLPATAIYAASAAASSK